MGGKKYGKPSPSAEGSEQSSDYSATTSLLAEEIVKEIGEPVNYSDRKMTWMYNCAEVQFQIYFLNLADMWCSKKIPYNWFPN